MAFEGFFFFFFFLKFLSLQKTLEPARMVLKCYQIANGSWKKRNFYWGNFLLIMQIGWTPVEWNVLLCSTLHFATETAEAVEEVCEWSWASCDLTADNCWAVFLQGYVYVLKFTGMTHCETGSLGVCSPACPSRLRDVTETSIFVLFGKHIAAESWNYINNYENSQRDALNRLIYYSQSALHVSGDVFAHHQEYLTVFTVSGSVHPSYCRLPAGSNLGEHYQIL